MRSGRTPAQNVDAAATLIRKAKSGGADYVLTPEMTNILERKRESLFAAIAPEEKDPSLAAFRDLARGLDIWVHVGSLAIEVLPQKAVNRSFLIDPKGEIAARYDKIHMFDVDLAGGESYRESRQLPARRIGGRRRPPWGRIGLTVCYDLRFPALYRALAEAGASFITIPSAFTQQTGEAHWHVLTRARAIENGCFRLCRRPGRPARGRPRHVRALDRRSIPGAACLAEGGTEPGVILADVDPSQVATVRARIPSLQHGRRFEMVEPIAEPAHLHVVRSP